MENQEKPYNFSDCTVQRVISSHLPPAGELKNEDDFTLERHLHREMLYVVKGESDAVLDGKVYHLTPGTLLLIDRWESHSYLYRKSDHDLLHLWFYLSTDHELKFSLMHIGAQGECRGTGYTNKFPREYGVILSNRWDRLKGLESHDGKSVDYLFRSAVNLLLEEFTVQNFSLIPQPQTRSSVDLAETISNYITQANGRNCSLEQLEKVTGFNRFYLAHVFRQSSGKSIGTMINERRVQFAAEAYHRGMPQKNIAVELGFSSPAAFSKWQRAHKEAIDTICRRLQLLEK